MIFKIAFHINAALKYFFLTIKETHDDFMKYKLVWRKKILILYMCVCSFNILIASIYQTKQIYKYWNTTKFIPDLLTYQEALSYI